MRALTNVELLDVWEAGLAQTATERALALLAAAEPDVPVEELARLPAGRRDRVLFLLRKATFGDELPLIAACPSCGEQVEADVRVDDLLIDGAPIAEAELVSGAHEVRFRLPNSIDLAAVAHEETTGGAAMLLLTACIVDARRDGDAIGVSELPDDVVTEVAERMAELDPQADVELAFGCPGCGSQWVVPFDIVSFFWAEIQYWAQRIVREVHALARAYAWSEREILRMSARRRHTYLDLIGG